MSHRTASALRRLAESGGAGVADAVRWLTVCAAKHEPVALHLAHVEHVARAMEALADQGAGREAHAAHCLDARDVDELVRRDGARARHVLVA